MSGVFPAMQESSPKLWRCSSFTGWSRCSLTLPYTHHYVLSSLRCLNRNVTLEAFPFLRRSLLYAKETRSCCVAFWTHKYGVRNTTARTVLCLEAFCLYTLSALRCKDSLLWLLSKFCSHGPISGRTQQSVLPLSYSSKPGWDQQCRCRFVQKTKHWMFWLTVSGCLMVFNLFSFTLLLLKWSN